MQIYYELARRTQTHILSILIYILKVLSLNDLHTLINKLMNENTYPFTLSRTEYRYEFVSISTKKDVKKIVLLSQTGDIGTYNLALLDLLEDGVLSDISETNNDDMITVLATVIQIINIFLIKYQIPMSFLKEAIDVVKDYT